MRPLRLILGALALAWVGSSPLAATPTPTFTISNATANAGQPEVFTITRASGGTGAYVLFETRDGTAHAGTDYTAVEKLVYLKAGVASATVSVPTAVNPAATGSLVFSAVVASTLTPAVGTATIVEPLPSTTTAWVGAPLSVGGYACNATQLGDPKTPACGSGIVYHIVGSTPNGPSVIYLAVFYADPSGHFPVNDQVDAQFISVWAPDQLQGLAPAP